MHLAMSIGFLLIDFSIDEGSLMSDEMSKADGSDIMHLDKASI